jgi:hypothetical protein
MGSKSIPAARNTDMAEYCSFCGVQRQPWEKKFDIHHIARQVNNPLWVTRVCEKCHRIWNAWHYCDRNVWTKESDPPQAIRLHEMLLGQARCIQLLAFVGGFEEISVVIAGIARGYITLAAKTDPTRGFSEEGDSPAHDSTNPSPALESLQGINYERILAAQAGIEAYLYEEIHGMEDPISKVLRLLEAHPIRVGTIIGNLRNEVLAIFPDGHPSSEYLESLAGRIIGRLRSNGIKI